MKFVFLVHVLVTWALVGLIWTIQQVHYPLFARVGESVFPAYERAHTTRILVLVFPLMTIELGTAFWLAIRPPAGIPAWWLWIGLVLVGIIWLATAFVHVPQHARLSGGFDADVHAALVTTNWLRTIIWSVRGVFVGWIMWQLLA
ncbi:MAG: hypothetical protein AAFR81_13495 [Chloroflexota bacterium]